MKMWLLTASLLALGGCVAPGYYVQPDYAGGSYDTGGYYGGAYDNGGYYGGAYDGGYYDPGYYGGAGAYPSYYGGGCCSVSIGYGYGYGYPGYYGWPGSSYGYYGYYYGGHHDHDGHPHHDDGGWDGPHHQHDGDGNDGWSGSGRGDQNDAAQPWRKPDRSPIPTRDLSERPHWSAPAPQMVEPGIQPQVTPRFIPHSQPGAAGHVEAPVHSVPPHRSEAPAPKKF